MRQNIVRDTDGSGFEGDRRSIGRGIAGAAILAACVGLMAAAPGYAQLTTFTGSPNPLPIQNMQPSLALHFAIQNEGIFGMGVPIRMFAYSPSRWSELTSGGWMPPDGRSLTVANNAALYAEIGNTYGGNSTAFNIPDLRGRTPVGEGQGPGLSDLTRGGFYGNSSPVLTASNLPEHTHTFGSTNTAPWGFGVPFNNRQDSLALHVSIAQSGLFPSRSGGSGFPVSPVSPWIGQIFFTSATPTVNSLVPAVGTSRLVNSNQAMYSIVATNFGGNGVTAFNLPDTRGRALSGYTITTPLNGRASRFMGESYGAESTILQVANMAPHNHFSSSGASTGISGGGQPFENNQPTLAVTYCIAQFGLFPSSTGMTDEDGYVGEIVAFAGNFVPDGYIPCDGRLVTIQSSTFALFALLGTSFGGNGSTNFGVPDLRSRVPIMASEQIPLGTVIGGDTASMNITQLPMHRHDLLQPPRCQPADIACDNGIPLNPTSGCTNTGVNEGDYNAFFAADGFFLRAGQGRFAIGSSCDIAYDNGEPLFPFGPFLPDAVNNGVNEGDYNCFFNNLFLGC